MKQVDLRPQVALCLIINSKLSNQSSMKADVSNKQYRVEKIPDQYRWWLLIPVTLIFDAGLYLLSSYLYDFFLAVFSIGLLDGLLDIVTGNFEDTAAYRLTICVLTISLIIITASFVVTSIISRIAPSRKISIAFISVLFSIMAIYASGFGIGILGPSLIGSLIGIYRIRKRAQFRLGGG